MGFADFFDDGFLGFHGDFEFGKEGVWGEFLGLTLFEEVIGKIYVVVFGGKVKGGVVGAEGLDKDFSLV